MDEETKAVYEVEAEDYAAAMDIAAQIRRILEQIPGLEIGPVDIEEV